MPSTYILTSVPYNLDDIRLGSLIPDIRQPHSDAFFVDTTSPSSGPLDVSTRTDHNPKVGLKTSERSWFDAHLSQLINASYDRGSEHEVQIAASEGHIYELRSPRTLFKTLIARIDVREWLQENILAGDKSYMVVGYRTFSDASATHQAQTSREAAAHVTLPVTDAVTGIPGVGQALGGGLDVGAGAGQTATSTGNQEATFPGERIYAICYRRVKLGFTRNVGNARLESVNQWIMYPDTRASASTDAQGEIVDANVDDEDDDESLEEELALTASGVAGDEVVFASLT